MASKLKKKGKRSIDKCSREEGSNLSKKSKDDHVTLDLIKDVVIREALSSSAAHERNLLRNTSKGHVNSSQAHKPKTSEKNWPLNSSQNVDFVHIHNVDAEGLKPNNGTAEEEAGPSHHLRIGEAQSNVGPAPANKINIPDTQLKDVAVELLRKIVGFDMDTVEDFCSKTPSVIPQLPVRKLKLVTALQNDESQKASKEEVRLNEAVDQAPGCQLNNQPEALNISNKNWNRTKSFVPESEPNVEEDSKEDIDICEEPIFSEDMVNHEEPFFTPLLNYRANINNIIRNLTDKNRSRELVEKLRQDNVRSIGDLCSKSAAYILQLPVKEPKQLSVLEVLVNYYYSLKTTKCGKEEADFSSEALQVLKANQNRNDNIEIVGVKSPSFLKDSGEEAIFSPLMSCTDDISNLIGDVVDVVRSRPLVEKLREDGIHTIGQLCSKNAAYILQLPVKEPILYAVVYCLEDYYNYKCTMEYTGQQPEEEAGTSQGLADLASANLKGIVSKMPVSQVVQAILDTPKRMECVSELLDRIGSVDKVMQYLGNMKVDDTFNEYWKAVREPLVENFSVDVVEFVTKRLLAATSPERPQSMPEDQSSSSSTKKPAFTIRSRKSLQTAVKEHGWTAVCRLIPGYALKDFLLSSNRDTVKEYFPPSILSEYIHKEIRSDKAFSKQIIQMALNAHLSPENDKTSLWNSVTGETCRNEEQYEMVEEFISRPDILSFIDQMTKLLSLVKPISEECANSQSILPDDVLQNLLKMISKQMQPVDFFRAYIKLLSEKM